MKRTLLSARVGAMCACFAVVAPDAAAFERQHHLGVSTGPSFLDVKGQGLLTGYNITPYYNYGLTDEFNLVAEGGFTWVSFGNLSEKRASPSSMAHALVGVTYVLDVLRWVPYAGLLAGVYTLGGGTLGETLVLPGVAGAAGLDYAIDRRWSVGIAYRQHVFLSDQVTTFPFVATALLRAEYVWGW